MPDRARGALPRLNTVPAGGPAAVLPAAAYEMCAAARPANSKQNMKGTIYNGK